MARQVEKGMTFTKAKGEGKGKGKGKGTAKRQQGTTASRHRTLGPGTRRGESQRACVRSARRVRAFPAPDRERAAQRPASDDEGTVQGEKVEDPHRVRRPEMARQAEGTVPVNGPSASRDTRARVTARTASGGTIDRGWRGWAAAGEGRHRWWQSSSCIRQCVVRSTDAHAEPEHANNHDEHGAHDVFRARADGHDAEG